MPSAADQLKYNRALKEAEEIQKRIDSGVNIRLKTAEKLEQLQLKISMHETKISMEKKAQYKAESDRYSLDQKIERISKSMLGNMSKLAGKGEDFSEMLSKASRNAKDGDTQVAAQANSFADMVEKINSGEVGPKEILDAMALTDFGPFEGSLVKMKESLEKTPHLQAIFQVKAKTFAALDKAAGGLLTTVRAIIAATGPIGLLMAAIGYIAAKAIEAVVGLAKDTAEIRQNLGTSAKDSFGLAMNMKKAGLAAVMAGGSMEQGKQAVEGLLEAFRTVDTVTAGTAKSTAKLMANTGLSGEEAGKLLKTMSLINGNSIETNVNTLLAKDNLSEAAKLRTANVMKQIAGDTNMFAKAGEQGADALFRAAMAAEKMGVELNKFDRFADSLLDVSSTMEKQFRLKNLLGVDMDMNSLMQAAQFGTLEDMQSELGRQLQGVDIQGVIGQGRAQRNQLEDILGFPIEDLMKIQQGQTVSSGGTPPVAKDTLSAANKSNSLAVKHHNENMEMQNKILAKNEEILTATKRMGT